MKPVDMQAMPNDIGMRARLVVARLRQAYPPKHAARPRPVKRPPLDELILTVLSQNTSDTNRDRAWASMRARYPTWEQVLGARTTSLATSIAIGGLANTKAPRIKAILAEVKRREGRLSLRRLSSLPDEEVRSYLMTLPGIGAKTAACVLAFSLGRPALPVDTHVARVAARLGLAGPKEPPDRIQLALESVVEPTDRLNLHLDLIAHGRAVCRAQRPACESCVLVDLCPSALPVDAGRAAPPRKVRPPRT